MSVTKASVRSAVPAHMQQTALLSEQCEHPEDLSLLLHMKPPFKLMSLHITQLLWEQNMEDLGKVSPCSHWSSMGLDTLVKWSGSPGRLIELVRRFCA